MGGVKSLESYYEVLPHMLPKISEDRIVMGLQFGEISPHDLFFAL